MAVLVPRPRSAAAQYADPYTPPAGYQSGAFPGDVSIQGPTRPTAPSRPASWPGGTVDSNQTNSISPNPPASVAPQQPRSGVTVWDPRIGQPIPAQGLVPTSPPSVSQGVQPGQSQNPYIAASPIQAPPLTAAPPSADPRVAMVPRQESYLSAPQQAYPQQSPQPGDPSAAPPVTQSLGTDPNAAAANLQIYPTDRKDLADAKVAARIGSEIILRERPSRRRRRTDRPTKNGYSTRSDGSLSQPGRSASGQRVDRVEANLKRRHCTRFRRQT